MILFKLKQRLPGDRAAMRPVPCGKHPCEALAAAMLNTERGGEVFDVAHAAEAGEIRENPPDRQTPFQFETAPRGSGLRSYNLQIADMTMGFGYTQYKDFKKLRELLKKYATPTHPLKYIAYHERLWCEDTEPLVRNIIWTSETNPSKVKDAASDVFVWHFSHLWHWMNQYIYDEKKESAATVPFRKLILMRLVGLIQFDFSPEVFERARREGLHWQPTRQDLRQPALVKSEMLVVLRPPAGQRPRNATAATARGLAEFVAEVARLCGPVEEGAAWFVNYQRWRGYRLQFPSTNLPPLEAVLSPAEAAFHLARASKKPKCSLCSSSHLYAYAEGLGHWWDLCWCCAGQIQRGARSFVFARYPLTVPPLLRVAPLRCVDGYELVPTGDKTYATIGPLEVCFTSEEIGPNDTVVEVNRILYCTS